MLTRFVSQFGRPWLSSDLANREYRRRLLCLSLAVLGLISFLFYIFPFSSLLYNPYANLAISVLTWSLMPLSLKPPLFFPVMHTASAGILVFLLYISVHTGGINSPLNVWLLIFPLPIMLLGGARVALWWLSVVSLCIVGMFVGSTQGWITYQLAISDNSYAVWSWLNNVCALVTVLAVISWYDSMRNRQYEAFDNRNHELRATHDALKQSQAHKEEFMAAVGHELRTPMNAILGLNGALREQLQDDPSSVEVVDHIRRSTQQLLTVVNNILDFSQLQAEELVLRPDWFDLPALFEEVVENLQDDAERYGAQVSLQIHAQTPHRTYLDRQRLYQIVFNLVENAIRYSQGSPVQVTVRPLVTGLHVEVQDHGPGVAPDLRASLFSRFEQPASNTPVPGQGAGLGLSICERLVNLQGGVIGLSSPVGGGACFWFDLPLEFTEEPPDTQAPHSAPDPQRALTVLLVDDDSVNLMVGRLLVQKHWPNAQVVVAQSAEDALMQLGQRMFDAMLVDMRMPDMDGPTLTRRIRASTNPALRRLPIIALTGNSHERDRQTCLDAGMNTVLIKPLDLSALKRAFDEHVRNRHDR
jgi:signal transduction histidine kinase/ActR/RegA family two-component response regulator